MNTKRRTLIKLSGFTAMAMALGCSEIDSLIKEEEEEGFSVALEDADATIDHYADRIVVRFTLPVDATSLAGNIYLRDNTGKLDYMHTVVMDEEDISQTRVYLQLNEGEDLNELWKYTVVVTAGVTSTTGENCKAKRLDFMTSARSPFDATVSGSAIRTKTVLISDIHLGKQSEADNRYILFTQNGERLRRFLEDVRSSEQIKELIILGDFMDMWVVPMEHETFTKAIPDAKAFFEAIADANREIIDALNKIADEGNIILSYVPGNHDMHFDETVFHAIFPNGVWRGDAPGTGIYYIEDDVAVEHGHNYDVFNAPDPLSTLGSILPPGYFITRIYASQNVLKHAESQSAPKRENIDTETYILGWDTAISTIAPSSFDKNKAQIVTGIDGYSDTYSSNSARDIYTDTIASNWSKRQRKNGVYQPEPFVIGAMSGSGEFWSIGSLKASAITQYFIPSRAKIVVFGHTHHAMVVKDFWTLYNIYANTGSWVDTEYANGHRTCTCIVLSSKTTKSDIKSATLYQYQEDYTLKKVSEENLDTSFF